MLRGDLEDAPDSLCMDDSSCSHRLKLLREVKYNAEPSPVRSAEGVVPRHILLVRLRCSFRSLLRHADRESPLLCCLLVLSKSRGCRMMAEATPEASPDAKCRASQDVRLVFWANIELENLVSHHSDSGLVVYLWYASLLVLSMPTFPVSSFWEACLKVRVVSDRSYVLTESCACNQCQY